MSFFVFFFNFTTQHFIDLEFFYVIFRVCFLWGWFQAHDQGH